MSIGIDFILRANASSFKQGMASVNNSIKDVKKSMREFDVGNGLKQALGVGGIIQGFRTAITNAQELRDEADKVGKAVSQGTRSVAEFGDALGRIGTGFKNTLTEGLSFFTGLGDSARHFFQGVTQEQEDAARNMVATTGKAADAAEAALRKSQMENSPERKQAAEERLAKVRLESQLKGTEKEKEFLRLFNERVELEEKLKKAKPATAEATNIRAAIQENENAQKKYLGEEAKANEDAKKKTGGKSIGGGVSSLMPSVEEMAAMPTGGFFDANDPRLKARKIVETEGFAKDAFARGDFKGGLELANKAQGMRGELDTTNSKLDELIKAVQGKFKAEP